jgi:hypothetical protein
MIVARAVIYASFPHVLQALWSSGLAALRVGRCAAIAAQDSEVQELHDLISGANPLDLYTRDGHRFIVYWLIMGATWPRYVTAARPAEFAIAAALGALFDGLNVRPGLLRGMVNDWLTWSETLLRLVAALRLQAIAEC